jgi:hypothetical protein
MPSFHTHIANGVFADSVDFWANLRVLDNEASAF